MAILQNDNAIEEGKGGTNQEPQNAATPRPVASPRRRKQPSTPAASAESTDDEVLE